MQSLILHNHYYYVCMMNVIIIIIHAYIDFISFKEGRLNSLITSNFQHYFLLTQASISHAWFCKIALSVYVCMRVCLCVHVCPPPRLLITSGMMWCDMIG